MEKFERNLQKEKASDMELAEFLIKHIDNPCTVEVEGRVENIRSFYIREAKRALETMTDSAAIDLLKRKIQEYEKIIHSQ